MCQIHTHNYLSLCLSVMIYYLSPIIYLLPIIYLYLFPIIYLLSICIYFLSSTYYLSIHLSEILPHASTIPVYNVDT